MEFDKFITLNSGGSGNHVPNIRSHFIYHKIVNQHFIG